MTITLHLNPDLEAGLLAQAHASGSTPEVYIRQLLEKDLSADLVEHSPSDEWGMVMENGLLVYRTGRPLPGHVVDDAIRRSREQRAHRILGDAS
jgi:hypothetical protein